MIGLSVTKAPLKTLKIAHDRERIQQFRVTVFDLRNVGQPTAQRQKEELDRRRRARVVPAHRGPKPDALDALLEGVPMLIPLVESVNGSRVIAERQKHLRLRFLRVWQIRQKFLAGVRKSDDPRKLRQAMGLQDAELRRGAEDAAEEWANGSLQFVKAELVRVALERNQNFLKSPIAVQKDRNGRVYRFGGIRIRRERFGTHNVTEQGIDGIGGRRKAIREWRVAGLIEESQITGKGTDIMEEKPNGLNSLTMLICEIFHRVLRAEMRCELGVETF
jgi:hypothetical protein